MSDETREEVVQALVAAHRARNSAYEFAALEFQFAPPPTEAERQEARSRIAEGEA